MEIETFSSIFRGYIEIDHSHCYSHFLRAVSKSVLKVKMLGYFREVEKTGEELVVTDHNKPVLKIVPIKPKLRASEVFGGFEGKVEYFEDIRKPTTSEWSDV